MKFFEKLGWQINRFMYGRYGTDTLNLVLIVAAFLCNLFGRNYILYLISLALITLALLRMFSRNIAARRRENEWLTGLFKRRPDAKTHRHFACPKCHQKVRVPKGKGKIMITCPKCGEKFAKKT